MVAGVLVVGLIVLVLQWVGSALHPLPAGVDPMDPGDATAFAAYLATMPFVGWALAGASELIGAFFGSLVAGRLATTRQSWFAGAIVCVALLGSISNWVSFSHPMWFIVGQLVGYPLVFLGVTKLLPSNPYEGQ